jgi:hypothetical protein
MRRQREQRQRFSEPYTYTTPEGATVESKTEYVGYGFTHYEITGTPEQIVAAGEQILQRFPNMPYSTTVYWPPEKWQHYRTPEEVSPGIWKAKAWHSNSSD